MRLIHTADWHLGQTLHGYARAFEHDRFLAWLLEQLEVHEADALIVAGDVFDVASPSAEALARYFGFLSEARRRRPPMDIVVVGGNHDAPARLDAARSLLDALRITVVGALPTRADDDVWDLDRVLRPLKGGAAGLVALPFLRPRDLPRSRAEAFRKAGCADPELTEQDTPRASTSISIVDGHRWVYEALTAAARLRFGSDTPLLATGHAYFAGTTLSEGSERKIQQGNQHALPASIFPTELVYVALGHLHLAQAVEGPVLARYSGSPIPLSMAELDYPHQVVRVDVEPRGTCRWAALHVPRSVELKRIPKDHGPLEDVLSELRALPREAPTDCEKPLIEVRIRLEGAEPRLRSTVEAALEGAFARLVRIDVLRPEEGPSPALVHDLVDLRPQEIFTAAHRRARADRPPPPELMTAFESLLVEAEETKAK